MRLEREVRPRGPYSLALTARLAGDATRTFRDGILDAIVLAEGRPERTLAWQRPDGAVVLRAESAAGAEALAGVLALDDDHSEFVRRFRRDALLGNAVEPLRGLRQLRVATVAQALLRALCGQLIEARRARMLERQIVRASSPPLSGTFLAAPPTSASLARFSPAELRALGLHARRGAALVRICGSLDLERLRDVPTDAAAARLERERSLGPWSVGVVCLEGLGRTERGLVGDLGLIRLCSAVRGRRAEAADTEELLAPYGEWAGTASVFLLAGWARGLLPVQAASRRDPGRRRAA